MLPGTNEWLGQVVEDIVDPGTPIVDPHHHLWPDGGRTAYGLDDLVADTGSGHHIVATVFVECRAAARPDGPDHLRPVGETEFVAASADRLTAEHPGAPPIAGIVANADLTLPDDALAEVLDAHAAAAGGRFVGIRDALCRALEPEALTIAGRYAEDKYLDPAFRAGVAELGRRGLTYDSWHYHHQNPEMLALARAVPGTTMVLDHFGTPLGVGMYADRRDEIFREWAVGVTELASCPNVVAKLGGLAMPDNGFGWHERDRPPTSDEFVAAQARYFHHTIEAFGPERCMFESNFPVDRFSLSYPVLWNGLKKIAARYTADERAAMFEGTARRIYGL
ncbi:amidohydrolase family protein [Ilumatobacter sp.]|uniref:amidohydrolase family protein n=1 Tax=Ilumatobacter sp. TaxID=1967498 RepID=UPI003AF83D77